MKRLSSSVGVAAAALVLGTIGATPATADTALAIGPRATLVARGVAVDVVLSYRCSAGAEVQTMASVELTQPVGHGGYTSAWGSLEALCDNVSHTHVVRLGVEDWDPVIRPGAATVHAEMWSYEPQGPSAQVWQKVRVARK